MPATTRHTITPLTTIEELDAALSKSAARPAVIFKHSATCGLSAMAAEEVTEWLDADTGIDADIYVVDVRRHRAVSNAAAERLRVRHESPQVLIVRAGAAIWHRSHAGVTAAAIERALAPAS